MHSPAKNKAAVLNRAKTAIDKEKAWRYGETVALSLVSLAEQNKQFASHLRRLIANAWPLPESENVPYDAAPVQLDYIAPVNNDIAGRRAEWLITNMAKQEIVGCAPAMLRAWARGEGAPKMLIVGVVGLAIPGLTLGLIKKKVNPMNCVISDTARAGREALARMAAQAISGVVAAALKTAENDWQLLDPDLGDWLFGEREIALYEGNRSALKKLANELSSMGVAQCSVRDNDEIQAVAMSPAVNGPSISHAYQLRLL